MQGRDKRKKVGFVWVGQRKMGGRDGNPTLQYLQTRTKTHTRHGTQPCNTYIPQAKHILDMGPNLTIFAFQTKTHSKLGTQQNAIFTFQTKTHT